MLFVIHIHKNFNIGAGWVIIDQLRAVTGRVITGSHEVAKPAVLLFEDDYTV